jgi:hypothetical protein
VPILLHKVFTQQVSERFNEREFVLALEGRHSLEVSKLERVGNADAGSAPPEQRYDEDEEVPF